MVKVTCMPIKGPSPYARSLGWKLVLVALTVLAIVVLPHIVEG